MIPSEETIDVTATEMPSEEGSGPTIMDNLNPEDDMLSNIERIFTNDDNIGFVTSRIPALQGIQTPELKMIITSVMSMLKEHGLEMFSAGNDGRAGKIKYAMDTSSVYFKLIADCLPTIHAIKNALKSKKAPETEMTDEDWAAVSLTQPEPTFNPNPNTRQVDPESLIKMPQPGQTRGYSGQGSMPGVAPPQRKMFTWNELLANHAMKCGTDGMGKAIQELRDRNIEVDSNIASSPKISGMGYGNSNSSWELEKRQAAMYGIQLPDTRDGLSLTQQQRQSQMQQDLIKAPTGPPRPIPNPQVQRGQPQPFQGQSEMTSSGVMKPTDASMAQMAQSMAKTDFVGMVENKNNLKRMPDFLLDEIY